MVAELLSRQAGGPTARNSEFRHCWLLSCQAGSTLKVCTRQMARDSSPATQEGFVMEAHNSKRNSKGNFYEEFGKISITGNFGDTLDVQVWDSFFISPLPLW